VTSRHFHDRGRAAWTRRRRYAVLFALLTGACGDDAAATRCERGERRACVGESECQGSQSCVAPELGFSSCDCSSHDAAAPDDAGDARGFDAAMVSSDAQMLDAAPRVPDSAMDTGAPPADAGPLEGDPLQAPGVQCAADDGDGNDGGVDGRPSRACAARSCLATAPRCVDDGERVSCCDRKLVPGGFFRMGRCTRAPDEVG